MNFNDETAQGGVQPPTPQSSTAHPPTAEDDFFGSATELPAQSRMTELFAEHEACVDRQEQLEAELEGTKRRIRELRTQEMPAELNTMGSASWVDPASRKKVELKTVTGYLPILKDKEEQDRRRVEIFDALEPLGVGELVRTEFTLNFAPSAPQARILRHLFGLDGADHPLLDGEAPERPAFTNYEEALIRDFIAAFELQQLPAHESRGANAQTLKAWLREQVKAGHRQTLLDAGISVGDEAVVTAPRANRRTGG